MFTANLATSDPDVMYWHEAMKQPDRANFLEAAHKEFDTMIDTKILTYIDKSDMPADGKLFPCVWSMKRKRRHPERCTSGKHA